MKRNIKEEGNKRDLVTEKKKTKRQRRNETKNEGYLSFKKR